MQEFAIRASEIYTHIPFNSADHQKKERRDCFNIPGYSLHGILKHPVIQLKHTGGQKLLKPSGQNT